MPASLSPVFILFPCSSAVHQIRLRPMTRSVTVEWKSGHWSTHSGVRRRDMLRLITAPSVGQWVNRCVLG